MLVAVETEAQWSRDLPMATQLVLARERDTTSVALRPLPLRHTAIVLKEEEDISLNMNTSGKWKTRQKKSVFEVVGIQF